MKSLRSLCIVFKCCQEIPRDYSLKLFLRTRIPYTIIFENRKLASPSLKKERKAYQSRALVEDTYRFETLATANSYKLRN